MEETSKQAEATSKPIRREVVEVKITDLIEFLKQGVTRCKGDLNYSAEVGSIEEKYNLTKDEVKEIFKHPKLAGIRVRPLKEKSFNLVDDTTPNEPLETKPTLGAPTTSALKRLGISAQDEKKEQTSTENVEVSEKVPSSKEEVDF